MLYEREYSQKFREQIVDIINENKEKFCNNSKPINLKYSINDVEFEEIMAYNDIVNHICKDADSDILRKYKNIISHQVLLNQNNKNQTDKYFSIIMSSLTDCYNLKLKLLVL